MLNELCVSSIRSSIRGQVRIRRRYPPDTLQTHFTHYLAPNTGAVHSAVSIGCTYVRSHSRGGPNDSSRGPSHTTFRYADGLAIDDGVRGYGSESQAKG